MRVLVTGRTPVIATVGLHGGGFVAEVKRSKGCLLWEVTRVNRNELPSRVVAWLTALTIVPSQRNETNTR